jgi:hypothetical protein
MYPEDELVKGLPESSPLAAGRALSIIGEYPSQTISYAKSYSRKKIILILRWFLGYGFAKRILG